MGNWTQRVNRGEFRWKVLKWHLIWDQNWKVLRRNSLMYLKAIQKICYKLFHSTSNWVSFSTFRLSKLKPCWKIFFVRFSFCFRLIKKLIDGALESWVDILRIFLVKWIEWKYLNALVDFWRFMWDLGNVQRLY